MVDNSLQTWYPVFKTAVYLDLKHQHGAENNFCCINPDTLRNFINKKRSYRRNCSMQEHPSRTEVWWCGTGKCSPYYTSQNWGPEGTNSSVWLCHSSPSGAPSRLPARGDPFLMQDAIGCCFPHPPQTCPACPQECSMAPDSPEQRANSRLSWHIVFFYHSCSVISVLHCINACKLCLCVQPACLKSETRSLESTDGFKYHNLKWISIEIRTNNSSCNSLRNSITIM